MKIAILASGSGSNLEAILRESADGRCAAEPVAVLSNNPGAHALERARKYNIPALLIDHRAYKTRQDHEGAIIDGLAPFEPKAIVLAGYMRMVTTHLIEHFHDRQLDIPGVLNIHPADTRAYHGAHGYEFAMGLLKKHRQRLRQTWITVHFVDPGMDTGPIIARRPLPIRPGDDLDALRERGLKVEHQLYPWVVDRYARGLIALQNGEVIVKEA